MESPFIVEKRSSLGALDVADLSIFSSGAFREENEVFRGENEVFGEGSLKTKILLRREETEMAKQVHSNTESWVFHDLQGELVGAYVPNLAFPLFSDENLPTLLGHLNSIPFTRVMYISKYNKANRTPRYTWAYGQVNANKPNPAFDGSERAKYSVLRSLPDPEALHKKSIVSYRGLDFESEVMPPWLEALAQYCRSIAIMNWGFDSEFNSVIIGKYDDGEDSIGFHEDSESFLANTFCANVTLGTERDFQFKMINADGSKTVHEIKLGHKSVFFFNALEHALPKRAGVKAGQIRYSISFRNMANDVGIGNSFYYCRGLAGAIDNEKKTAYQEKLRLLQEEREGV